MSVLAEKHFHDEAAAYEWVEARVWPQGPVCPRCGGSERISKMQGRSTRMGVYKCYKCRKPFTVKVGTIFEASHIPMHIWLQGIFLLCGSKKGISSNQLHRALGVTLKSAWFLSHRIREAMRSGDLAPMGGNGGIVEVDETYINRKKGHKVARGYAHKMAVLTLIDRKGEARSFHLDKATKKSIIPIIKENISRESKIASDSASFYRDLKNDFAGHESVNHYDEEWVRGEIHTNRAEGYFSVFKRGMRGVYQHCSEKHLHRYLAEYDFRYNARIALGVNDEQRAEKAVRGVVGKRLTYQTAS